MADKADLDKTLQTVKSENDTNQIAIDKVYSEACELTVHRANETGLASTTIQSKVKMFCQRLTANSGD